MEHNYSILAYLISGVFFILALRGLSSPETARRGNIYGISGMVIAIVATLLLPGIESYVLIVLGILIGGIIGTSIALKIKIPIEKILDLYKLKLILINNNYILKNMIKNIMEK